MTKMVVKLLFLKNDSYQNNHKSLCFIAWNILSLLENIAKIFVYCWSPVNSLKPTTIPIAFLMTINLTKFVTMQSD